MKYLLDTCVLIDMLLPRIVFHAKFFRLLKVMMSCMSASLLYGKS